jgi:hypothetical protein
MQIDDEEWDQLLKICIDIFANEVQEAKAAEKLISKIIDPASKVTAYIMCRKLRAAYLFAVRLNDVSQIERIKEESKTMDSAVYELCQLFLQKTAELRD